MQSLVLLVLVLAMPGQIKEGWCWSREFVVRFRSVSVPPGNAGRWIPAKLKQEAYTSDDKKSDIPMGTALDQAKFVLNQCRRGDYHNAATLSYLCLVRMPDGLPNVSPAKIGTTPGQIKWYRHEKYRQEAITLRDENKRGDHRNAWRLALLLSPEFGVKYTEIGVTEKQVTAWYKACLTDKLKH